MLNAVSGYSPYSAYGAYGASYANRASRPRGGERTQPETPVQPVTPARPVSSQEDPAQAGLLRFASDPAEMAVRMRIQTPGDAAQQAGAQAAGAEKAQAPIPGLKTAGDGQEAANPALGESKSAQEVMEEGRAKT